LCFAVTQRNLISCFSIDYQQARCGYIVLILSVYWIFEAIPLPVTSLLPLALFPLVKNDFQKRKKNGQSFVVFHRLAFNLPNQ